MKKTLFLIFVGILWIQVPHFLSPYATIFGLPVGVDGIFAYHALGLFQDAIVFAIAASVLAFVFFISNYDDFSRRDVAVSLSPMAFAGLVGLFVFSSDVSHWILLYQVFSIAVAFIVTVIAVPLYIRLFGKLQLRDA